MAATVILFDPTAPRQEPAGDRLAAQQAVVSLSGAIVGFIDNAKPNFHHLVDDLAALLTSQYGVRRVITRRKPSAFARRVRSIKPTFCRVSANEVGAFRRRIAMRQASATSAGSAGRMTNKCGMARSAARCSIG